MKRKLVLILILCMTLCLTFSAIGCSQILGKNHEHNFNGEWQKDENNHWKECTCGEEAQKAKHIDSNSDYICDTCARKLPEPPKEESGCNKSAAIVLMSVISSLTLALTSSIMRISSAISLIIVFGIILTTFIELVSIRFYILKILFFLVLFYIYIKSSFIYSPFI